MASTESSRVVHMLRRGNMVDQVVPPSPSRVSGLEWDPHMGTLAIMQEHSKVVVMWNASSQTRKMLDVGVKDGLWMSWSTSRNLLALGTSRGRVLIYDTEDCSRVQVRTEHRRSVTAGAWNKSNCLAFVSDARSVTMCSAEGEILDRFKVKGKPLSVRKKTSTAEDEDALCVNLDGKSILLYAFSANESALELRFQPQYGTIAAYEWFNSKSVVMGFSTGFVVVVYPAEKGDEQKCLRVFKDAQLADISFCAATGLLAACGGSTCHR